jgi:hypothetical protein
MSESQHSYSSCSWDGKVVTNHCRHQSQLQYLEWIGIISEILLCKGECSDPFHNFAELGISFRNLSTYSANMTACRIIWIPSSWIVQAFRFCFRGASSCLWFFPICSISFQQLPERASLVTNVVSPFCHVFSRRVDRFTSGDANIVYTRPYSGNNILLKCK